MDSREPEPDSCARIAFTHTVPAGEEQAFVRAWTRCKGHMVALGAGPTEILLLRSVDHPARFVTLTTWESLEAWRSYWSRGVPDPEGESCHNERWEEVAALRRPASAGEGPGA